MAPIFISPGKSTAHNQISNILPISAQLQSTRNHRNISKNNSGATCTNCGLHVTGTNVKKKYKNKCPFCFNGDLVATV